MKRIICAWLAPITMLGAYGCASNRVDTAERKLIVFAAASLTDAFSEIGAGFEALHPGVTVEFNFSNAHTLQTQIEAGAPADLFASASNREMNMLVSKKMIDPAAPLVFAVNKLIIILPRQNPGRLFALEDLARPGIKLVLAAEQVPAGYYARVSLVRMNGQLGPDFSARVLENLVSNEDTVRQVVAKVELGEADAGFAYFSDSVSSPDLQVIEIPEALNISAEYPIAPLASTSTAVLANSFIDYVLSPAGRAILSRWGFDPHP